MFMEKWELGPGPVSSEGSGRAAGFFPGIAPIIQTHHKPPAAANFTLQGIIGGINERMLAS